MLAGLSKGETEVFKNGKLQLNLTMLALNDAGGRRIGDLVVMRDITALRQTFSTSVTAVVLLSLLAGADCHAFIQSMLRFSKVFSFASKPMPMDEVIAETVLMFRQTARRPISVETC